MKAKKNGGYSLIELLVAVVILAIIAAPFLHSFVVSAKANAKARKVEEAAIAGQNVMEELKAADIETIKNDPGTTITEVTGGRIITFTSESIFVGNRVFEAKVTLDSTAAAPAPGATASDPEAENEITDYNRESLAQLYSMDSQYDGIYVQPADQDTLMAGEFGVVTSTMGNLYRNIVVNISKSGDDTAAEVETKYICGGVEKYASPQRQYIYSNTDASVKLRNVYIFFYPMYNSNGTTAKETITINNNDCIPVNVYLIKQPQTTGNESLYKVNVRVVEKNRTQYLEDGKLKPLTRVRTNLSPTADLTQTPQVYQQLAQLTYSTDGVNFQPQKVVNSGGVSKSFGAEELLELKNLNAEEVDDRVYRTKVEVYERDDAGHEVLVSLTGTKEK